MENVSPQCPTCARLLSRESHIHSFDGHAPFWPNFYVFCLAFLTLDPAAKFDVCSFIVTGDNRGVTKFKSRSRDLGHIPFWRKFYFCLVFLTVDPATKFDVCSFIVTGDNRGSQNSKVGHVTSATPLFDPIFIFFV